MYDAPAMIETPATQDESCGPHAPACGYETRTYMPVAVPPTGAYGSIVERYKALGLFPHVELRPAYTPPLSWKEVAVAVGGAAFLWWLATKDDGPDPAPEIIDVGRIRVE